MTEPLFVACLATGVIMGGLLVGYEPVGGDPDTMYRPIKAALATALRQGTLAFWSDRFGLGVPLAAESHAAAFYPLNWLLYGLVSVPAAYRLAMWLHYVAIAAGTYGYARMLKISAWGSALAALAFTFCGFQAGHLPHEPFYHVLAWMPPILIAAERYLATSRTGWVAAIALCWGMQLTLGHFQLQAYTAGVVLVIGVWRTAAQRRPWWLVFGLVLALAWGAAIAAAQLGLTSELRKVAGFDRPYKVLLLYSFPPAHWPQLAFPRLFLNVPGGAEGPYWRRQQTTEAEACLYVGTIPFILAIAGLLSARTPRTKEPRQESGLAPWTFLGLGALVLGTMPRWWPEGYEALLHLPGFGLFRAPGRYTLLTCMALSLWAGRGLDRSIDAAHFWRGVGLALLFALLSGAFLVWSGSAADLRETLGNIEFSRRLVESAFVWAAALLLVVAWRRAWIGPAVIIFATALELAWLYYHDPGSWGWSVRLPEQSPVFRQLLALPDVGLVAGPMENIPVRVGLTPAYPYLGIVPPPPIYLLEDAKSPEKSASPTVQRWMRRFGVSHGIWNASASPPVGRTLYEGRDRALDRLVPRKSGTAGERTWRLIEYTEPFPRAHVALKAHEVADWYELYPRLSHNDFRDEAWYLRGDQPEAAGQPWATSARVLRWDGRSGEIEHDGTCDLIIRRTYFPGWVAHRNEQAAIPVARVDGGLQAVRLPGRGTTKVRLEYQPTSLGSGLIISGAAVLLAVLVLGRESWLQRRIARQLGAKHGAD